MELTLVYLEWHRACVSELRAFSTEDKADAFLARIAREEADERGEDFVPGEWAEYLIELSESRVLDWDKDTVTVDEEG